MPIAPDVHLVGHPIAVAFGFEGHRPEPVATGPLARKACATAAAPSAFARPREYVPACSYLHARMEGFLVFDYMSRAAEAIAGLAGWVQAGKIVDKIDVQHGLENAPETLRRLFEGRNEGKQLLRVAE